MNFFNFLYFYLDKIEDNVIDIKENADQADSQIREADKDVISRKKMLLLVLAIIAVIGLVLIVVFCS